MQGTCVWSLVRELRPPHATTRKRIAHSNENSIQPKVNKDFFLKDPFQRFGQQTEMAEADNWPVLCGQGVSRPAGKGGPGITGLRGQCVLRSAEGQDTLWGELSYIISLCAWVCKCAFTEWDISYQWGKQSGQNAEQEWFTRLMNQEFREAIEVQETKINSP